MAGPKFFGVDIQGLIADAFTPENTMSFKLRKLVQGDYDPANPSSGRTTVETDYDCHGVISSYTRDEMSKDRNIEEGDSKAAVVAKDLFDAGIEPEKDDQFVDDLGKLYSIVAVKTNGLRAMYFLQIRG